VTQGLSFADMRALISTRQTWASSLEGLNRNFAGLFPFIDLALGTFYMPPGRDAGVRPGRGRGAHGLVAAVDLSVPPRAGRGGTGRMIRSTRVGGSMRRLLLSVSLAASWTVWLFAQQAAPPAGTPKPPQPNAAMNGLWDYNDTLSLDAATGEREQAPLSAAQRARVVVDRPAAPPPGVPVGGPAAGGASAAPASAGTSAWGMGGGTTSGAGATTGVTGGAAGGSVDDFERSTRDMFLAERRGLVRDLLEVPEVLRIRVTNEAVTFVDDLQRLRTYPSSGRLQKYQIGAAQFQARAYWDGAEFHKEIEAPAGFRMFEVYRVSDNGTQLFVTLRIGDPKKNARLVGVNRVYNRVAGR
jgi:hypothetical protein